MKISVNKETIRNLSDQELRGVKGGTEWSIGCKPSNMCSVTYCSQICSFTCSLYPTCTCGCYGSSYKCPSDTCAPSFTCGCKMKPACV